MYFVDYRLSDDYFCSVLFDFFSFISHLESKERYWMPHKFFVDFYLVLQAQGLLKTAVSTGQSKEARLARVRI